MPTMAPLAPVAAAATKTRAALTSALSTFRVKGLFLIDHTLKVPVNYAAPEQFGSIDVFVREVRKASDVDEDGPPSETKTPQEGAAPVSTGAPPPPKTPKYLLYLQGGPGYRAGYGLGILSSFYPSRITERGQNFHSSRESGGRASLSSVGSCGEEECVVVQKGIMGYNLHPRRCSGCCWDHCTMRDVGMAV